MLLVLAVAGLACAEGPGPRPRTMGTLFASTGFVGLLMVGATALALFLAIRRRLDLRPARLAPAPLQRSLELALHAGEPDRALREAESRPSLLGDLVAAGLRVRGAGLDDMLSSVERRSTQEALRLGNGIANLARLGGLILLAGLLGSALSFMNALIVIERLKEPRLQDFAGGLAPALACAAFGLAFAVFCFGAFFLLDHRLTARAIQTREIAEDMLRMAAEKTRPPG
jgi:biopolymer transport protein ExbB/TolQ